MSSRGRLSLMTIVILLAGMASIAAIRTVSLETERLAAGLRLATAYQESWTVSEEARKLKLERNSLGSPERLERLATSKLDLRFPLRDEVVVEKVGPEVLAAR